MVGPGEVDEYLEPETFEECGKYGKVSKCLIFEVGVDLQAGQKVIKHISCSTQLSMTFKLLIVFKIAAIVGILTFKSRINFMLSKL